MAELNTADVDKAAASLVEAGFAAGFTDDTPPAPAAKVEVPPKVEPEPKPAAATPAKPPEKPQYAKVLQHDWDNLKAAAGKVSSLESQIAKLTGSMPKADAIIQQVIEKVQSQTPAGHAVEFSKEDLAELSEDYPELAEKLERVLNKGRVKGTGPAEPASAPAKADAPDLEKTVEQVIAKRERQRESDALAKAHPDWGKIVGQPIAMGTTEPVQTDWRKWLAEQPAEYQKEVSETDQPSVIHASIDMFLASQKAPATPATPATPDRAAARRAVIEDAVTPRADGAPPPLNQPKSVDDAFAEGFRGG